jgi:hypothetical protein
MDFGAGIRKLALGALAVASLLTGLGAKIFASEK